MDRIPVAIWLYGNITMPECCYYLATNKNLNWMFMHALIIGKQIKWTSYRFNRQNLWLECWTKCQLRWWMYVALFLGWINVCERKPSLNQLSMHILNISSGFCTVEYFQIIAKNCLKCYDVGNMKIVHLRLHILWCIFHSCFSLGLNNEIK